MLVINLKSAVFAILSFFFWDNNRHKNDLDGKFESYECYSAKSKIKLLWKNDKGEKFGSLGNAVEFFSKSKTSIEFAMNCGMYTPEYDPVGLYIENGKKITKLKLCNNKNANFCINPQGVFYIKNDQSAGLSTVGSYSSNNVAFAIEAAPILILNGKINDNLPTKSTCIRNGVGVANDGKIVFAISKMDVTFIELAQYFISRGCTKAVYFDGGISKAYFNDKRGTVPKVRRKTTGMGVCVVVFK
jgi:uncharacterized protein YigE (DUF2233 family)